MESGINPNKVTRYQSPDITVELVPKADKPILWRLVQLYLYEFTKYEPADVNEQGEYEEEHFDLYWKEPQRHPFFIRVDGKLAGFVMVRQLPETENHRFSIAEFFVMHTYRRKGIGTVAAHKVFDMFGPLWEICQVKENAPSLPFWQKTIHAYTGGDFTNYPDGYKYWTDGPVQHFRSQVNT